MKIKIFNQFEKDEIVDMPKFFARSLIKRGRACEIAGLYNIMDLCCAQIGTVEDCRVHRRLEGFPDDMTIYFQPERISICTYEKPKFKKSIFVKGDYYTHLAGDKTYISDSSNLNCNISRGEKIVNSSTVNLLVDVYDDVIQECGYGGKVEFALHEIVRLENAINEKYKYFLLGQRNIRSKYSDAGIALFSNAKTF